MSDSVVRGLSLRITKNDVRSWSLLKRINGKKRRITLGEFPTLSVKLAREAARAVLVDISNGKDLSAWSNTHNRTALPPVSTLSQLLDEYERVRLSQKPIKSWGEYRRSIESVFNSLADRELNTLKPYDFQKALDSKAADGSPVRAARTWSYIRPVLAWAEKRELCPPIVSNIDKPIDPSARSPRDRVLSDTELARVWKTCEKSEGPHYAIIQMLILTGQRLSEVTGMTSDELDLTNKTWTLSASRTKSRREHVVPLSSAAVRLIKTKGKSSGLVFPGPKDNQITQNWHRFGLRIQSKSKTSNWTRHDLRRTCATGLAALDVPPIVIEHVLNHADPHQLSGASRVAGVYQRYSYQKEMRQALDRWASHVGTLTKKHSLRKKVKPQ